MLELLKELCDANGVTGFEKEVGDIIADKIKNYCDRLYYDKLGNLVAFKKGKKAPSKRVMYCAHLDEVGMMIKHINEDGTLMLSRLGMTHEVLPGKHVVVGKNKIPGVICSLPVHLSKDKEKDFSENDLYIDIGTLSREGSARLNVYGEYACFKNDFCVFGDGSLVRSKALDDRVGCLVMIKLIMSELAYDSYFVFTVGEELGGTGASYATREIAPYISIVFESTTASDLPCNKGADRVCSLGDGAVVPFMDGGTIYDNALYKKIRELGNKESVKTQTKTKIAGGTDAASIQRSIDGVRVAAVSLPCRYIHTSSCVGAVDDINSQISLAFLIDKHLEELIESR